MDGYAVRHDDLGAGEPVTLTEIGTAYAGRNSRARLEWGVRARHDGAVMPKTRHRRHPGSRQCGRQACHHSSGQERGQNRRLAGEDLQKGKPALRAGRMLRPADIGLIASLGIGEVSVRRKLKVAFFSTGDELVSVGKKLKAGDVYDSNRYSFGACSRALGAR